MRKENPKETVCQMFEKVNTGGVSLTVFELFTATYASDEYDLKEDWQLIRQEFKPHKVLGDTSNTDLMQSITLYSTYQKRLAYVQTAAQSEPPAISAKRKDLQLEKTNNKCINRTEIELVIDDKVTSYFLN